MDNQSRPSECDGAGRRTPAAQSLANREDFPGRAASEAFPAGSTVNGTLYFSSDLAEDLHVTIRLEANGTLIASASANVKTPGNPDGIVTGATTWVPATFQAGTSVPVPPGSGLTLSFEVSYRESYWIGLAGDHASAFTIDSP